MLPFIDLKYQYSLIRDEIHAGIDRVLESGHFILGAEIAELEKQLAEYAGVKHALACSSGTDALLMALMALEIGPGDAVFTTPFTFFATVETIALVGATPVFADIDPGTYNIDPAKLEEAILKVEREGKLVALVFPDETLTKRMTFDEIQQLMKANLAKLNSLIPSYSKVADIEVQDQPFEKTPKKSIKRFLYK